MIRRLINSFLRKVGFEIRRVENKPGAKRASMNYGIKWLAQNQFKINTIIDVGASNGSWTKMCMACFPEAKYILFEPQPVHSNALDNFINTAGKSVVAVKKAVGANVGYTHFDASDPLGGALADKASEKTIEVEITTIDACLSEMTLNAPCLIKLDTHGYEKSILEGANDTLSKTDVLVIEAYNYKITDEAFLFWELCGYLAEKGFRPIDLVDVMHRKYDDSLWQMDLFFIRDGWQGFNYRRYQ